MGSLVTAVASYLDIKQQGGTWFVRIDDLDPPRQDPRASTEILQSLAAHGLLGDLPVDYQSNHEQRYATALQQIAGHLFYCSCTRKAIAGYAVYPGFCRQQKQAVPDTALRVNVAADVVVSYDDAKQGPQTGHLASESGDFIVRRRDGLWAYNFATAVDDGFDVTQVMRGQDLQHVTPPQIYIMQLLGLQPPRYAHLPLLRFADGTKLSKQAHAPAVRSDQAAANLQQAMRYLGLQPPRDQQWNVREWLAWGLEHWSLRRVPEQLPPYAVNGT